jgi:5-methylthioribose kinase
MFELTLASAPGYLVRRGLAPAGEAIEVAELPGGVSATVISARVPSTGSAVVVKQALQQLRVRDEWLATPDRAETEVAAMTLCGAITPGVVPGIIDSDPTAHVLVMELISAEARNWQAEVAEGRVHTGAGRWAGATLGAWHAQTVGDAAVAAGFDDFEAFEQLRLRPFYETVIERRPELADEIVPLLEELRHDRRCFVHGDYSLKNMLIAPTGNWVLDFEVAHYGSPVFDLGFFLSFVLLSAIRWELLTPELRVVADDFLAAYEEVAGTGFAGGIASVSAHTAALMLARTDGKSPAQFLDPSSRARARRVGVTLLRAPDRGLWQWL